MSKEKDEKRRKEKETISLNRRVTAWKENELLVKNSVAGGGGTTRCGRHQMGGDRKNVEKRKYCCALLKQYIISLSLPLPVFLLSIHYPSL